MRTKLFIAFLAISSVAFSQKYLTKNGFVGFYSKAPLEEIKPNNNQVASVLDIQTGEIVFTVLIKSFVFENSLMQEHFNENYMESDKFPKASFKGKITNLKEVDFSKLVTYSVNIEGEMTMHGVTKLITTKGTLEIQKDKIIGKSKFNITLADYNVTIPSMAKQKIAEQVEITVEMNYEPFSK